MKVSKALAAVVLSSAAILTPKAHASDAGEVSAYEYDRAVTVDMVLVDRTVVEELAGAEVKPLAATPVLPTATKADIPKATFVASNLTTDKADKVTTVDRTVQERVVTELLTAVADTSKPAEPEAPTLSVVETPAEVTEAKVLPEVAKPIVEAVVAELPKYEAAPTPLVDPTPAPAPAAPVADTPKEEPVVQPAQPVAPSTPVEVLISPSESVQPQPSIVTPAEVKTAPEAPKTPSESSYNYSNNLYPIGECTWGVKAVASWAGYWGNAMDWPANARNAGFETGSTPKVGAIISWDGGGFGHVAYVTAVNETTGQIQVLESNYDGHRTIANYRGWFTPTGIQGNVTYIYAK